MDKEKKLFLLDKSISNLLMDIETRPVLHEIFFTKIKLCKEVRYEHTPKHYIKVVKTGAQFTQTVTYHKSHKKEFADARQKKKGHLIRKMRYTLRMEGCSLIIDRYHKQLENLCLMIIPQECRQKVTSLLQNKLLSQHIREDVTSDPRYEEKYLALFGNPSRYPYNIYTIFKEIEHRRLQKVEDVIFAEMKSADALRIILFQKERDILGIAQKASKNKTISHEGIETYLYQLRQIEHLTKLFDFLFDPLALQRITSHLQKILNVTQTYEDLTFIRNAFKKLKGKIEPDYLKKLQSNLDAKITAEREKIIRYFGSREFSIIIRQFELFLKEKKRSYNSYEAQLPVGYTLKLEQKKLLGNLQELIDLLDGCNDEASYRRIEASLEKLNTFLTLFQPLNMIRIKPGILQNIKKVRKCMLKHNNRHKRLLVINMVNSEATLRKEKKTHKILLKKETKLLEKEKTFAHSFYRRLHKLGKKLYHL